MEPNAIGATRSIGRNDANRSEHSDSKRRRGRGERNHQNIGLAAEFGPIATMEASSTIMPEIIARRVGVSRNNAGQHVAASG